jgi:hypothetical protein
MVLDALNWFLFFIFFIVLDFTAPGFYMKGQSDFGKRQFELCIRNFGI